MLFRYNEVIRRSDLHFQGFCYIDNTAIGFDIVMPDYDISSWSKYIILGIEAKNTREAIKCYDYLNGIIRRYAEAIWGPLLCDMPAIGLRLHPQLNITYTAPWSRAIVIQYSTLLSAYKKANIKNALKDINTIISEDQIGMLIDDISSRISQRGAATVSRVLYRLLRDDIIMENKIPEPSFFEDLLDCLYVLDCYVRGEGEYSNIIKEVAERIRVLEDEAKAITDILINELRKSLQRSQ